MSAPACSTGCTGMCDQGRARCEHVPREGGSACSEFLADTAPRIPRRRLGSVGRRQCWLIKHGATVTLVIALGGFAVLGWLR